MYLQLTNYIHIIIRCTYNHYTYRIIDSSNVKQCERVREREKAAWPLQASHHCNRQLRPTQAAWLASEWGNGLGRLIQV